MPELNKYFVQVVDKGNKTVVQEVEPKMFFYLQKLPKVDPASNEPPFFILERYPNLPALTIGGEVVGYYVGVGKVGNDLFQMFHYFLTLGTTKLKPMKRKPIFIADQAVIQQQKKQ